MLAWKWKIKRKKIMQRDKTVQFWNDFYSNSSITSTTKNDDVTAKDSETTTCSRSLENKNNIPQENNNNSNPVEKEWIVHPSPTLFETICSHLPAAATTKVNVQQSDENPNTHVKILEIGCGVSNLAKDFWIYLNHLSSSSSKIPGSSHPYSLIATDVSSVCISQMKNRDADIIQASTGHFNYEELNVLEKNSSICSQYDLILDKGCLDTFLFRSQAKVQWEIMQSLLDNIHEWLNDGGVYLILSPRSKIKFIRDYAGFQNVRRFELKQQTDNNDDNDNDTSTSSPQPVAFVLGDLDGRSARNATNEQEKTTTTNKQKGTKSKKDVVYMHVCAKKDSYIPGGSVPAFSTLLHLVEEKNKTNTSSSSSLSKDEMDKCTKCGITFQEFIGSDVDMGQGEKTWKRRFQNHRTHCQS